MLQMSNDGLIIENMDLPHIHLAVTLKASDSKVLCIGFAKKSVNEKHFCVLTFTDFHIFYVKNQPNLSDFFFH